MAANTRLRRLAELHPERGKVLSVFFNLDPREFATPPARAPEIHSGLTAAATFGPLLRFVHGADFAARRIGAAVPSRRRRGCRRPESPVAPSADR